MRPSKLLDVAQHRWFDTMNHWRSETVDDAGGGRGKAWQLLGETQAMFATPSAAEQSAAAQQGDMITHLVVLPGDTPVRRGDRLHADGITVEVGTPVGGTHATTLRAGGRQEPWDEPLDQGA